MATKAKVKNPASSLLIVNGRKKMATRAKRKTTNTRRRATSGRRAAPRARNQRRATSRRTNRRRANPVRRRRRNPQVKTLLIGAVYAAAGAMAHGAVSSFIPIKASGPMGLLVSGGTAYLTWWIGERILSGQNALAFGLGAAGGFGAQVINYAMGLASQFTGQLAPATAPQIGGGDQKALPPPPPDAELSDIAIYDHMGDVGIYN